MSAYQEELMRKGLPKRLPINGVKKTILVASGKGGVGKSTVAVNLATAMKILEPDKNVGLLDADVFGPSVPLMMNTHGSPLLTDAGLIMPLTNYGVKCISMGNLIPDDSAVVWRGLMVMKALGKLIRNVDWNPVDYLILDSPPGTGDTHLSLAQSIPINGAVIVTTGQQAALNVSRRGIIMLEKFNIPIIGIIHNMSSVVCRNCSQSTQLFGGKINDFAEENDIQILGSIPINDEIAVGSDSGKPIVILSPESSQAIEFFNIAKKVLDFLAANKE